MCIDNVGGGGAAPPPQRRREEAARPSISWEERGQHSATQKERWRERREKVAPPEREEGPRRGGRELHFNAGGWKAAPPTRRKRGPQEVGRVLLSPLLPFVDGAAFPPLLLLGGAAFLPLPLWAVLLSHPPSFAWGWFLPPDFVCDVFSRISCSNFEKATTKTQARSGPNREEGSTSFSKEVPCWALSVPG